MTKPEEKLKDPWVSSSAQAYKPFIPHKDMGSNVKHQPSYN